MLRQTLLLPVPKRVAGCHVGKTIYNRTSRRLGQKLVKNPGHAWVRGAAAIEPIVDPGVFARAQKLLAERRVEIPEDEMLLRLRLTLRRCGKLNSRILNTTLGRQRDDRRECLRALAPRPKVPPRQSR